MPITLNGTTGIQTPLGSASVPADSNTTNSNSGLYFPTGTNVALAEQPLRLFILVSDQGLFW
jgi:hypothetical protein